MNILPGKEKKTQKTFEAQIDKISPNPNQPRKVFEEKELIDLCDSIKLYGVITPISLRSTKDGYELIAGERRLRAAKMAGLKKIPAMIIEAGDRISEEMSLVENLLRSDLNFFEEAEAISHLMENYGLTQQEIAQRLCKRQSTVANKIRILRLNEEERKIILKQGLTERHARALIKIEDKRVRQKAILHIIKKNLNVSATEDYIEKLLNGEEKKPTRVMLLKDIRIFINTINHAVEVMKSSGINVESEKTNLDGFVEYKIKIPVQT